MEYMLPIFHLWNNLMIWNVAYTEEFGSWWTYLTESEREDISATPAILMERGPELPFPHSSGIEGSKHSHMRELRVQSSGKPLRIFARSIPSGRQSC
jgi:hypothetical protein